MRYRLTYSYDGGDPQTVRLDSIIGMSISGENTVTEEIDFLFVSGETVANEMGDIIKSYQRRIKEDLEQAQDAERKEPKEIHIAVLERLPRTSDEERYLNVETGSVYRVSGEALSFALYHRDRNVIPEALRKQIRAEMENDE